MSKNIEIGKRMRLFGEKNFSSMAEFAVALDMSPQTLNQYLNGKQKPGKIILERLVKIGCNEQWLLFGNIPEPKRAELFGTVKYPVVSHIRAGNGDTNKAYTYESLEQLDGPSDPKYKESLYFIVKGDSMEPKWEEGDHVLVNPKQLPKHGEYAVVCWNEKDGALKKVFYQESNVILQSLNLKYEAMAIPKEEIWFIGKVISTLHH